MLKPASLPKALIKQPPLVPAGAPRPEVNIVFKAVTATPDLTNRQRGEIGQRTVRAIESSMVDPRVPWITVDDPTDVISRTPKKIRIPAMIAIRATCRDVKLKHATAPDLPEELWTSWNVWGAPRLPLIIQKIADRRIIKLFDALHARLAELGARKGGWWQINFCPLGVNGGNEPIIQITCSAMTPLGMKTENERVQKDGNHGQRMFWNPLRRVCRMEEFYPPGHIFTHVFWDKDTEIKEQVRLALTDFAQKVVDRVWTSWATNDLEIHNQLLLQGVIMDAQAQTHMGQISLTQIDDPGQNNTRYFHDFDPDNP